MALAHISLGKGTIALIAAVVTAAIALVTDPTVKVAIVVGLSTVVAALFASTVTLILGVLSYRLQKQTLSVGLDTKHQTDGILGRMTERAEQSETKANEQQAALDVANSRADRAEAGKLGSDEERGRDLGRLERQRDAINDSQVRAVIERRIAELKRELEKFGKRET
jgi:hypothetical protein